MSDHARILIGDTDMARLTAAFERLAAAFEDSAFSWHAFGLRPQLIYPQPIRKRRRRAMASYRRMRRGQA